MRPPPLRRGGDRHQEMSLRKEDRPQDGGDRLEGRGREGGGRSGESPPDGGAGYDRILPSWVMHLQTWASFPVVARSDSRRSDLDRLSGRVAPLPRGSRPLILRRDSIGCTSPQHKIHVKNNHLRGPDRGDLEAGSAGALPATSASKRREGALPSPWRVASKNYGG